jgi:hypothetical protein
MSNFLAIATVTETLRYVLEAFVKVDVQGALATAVRPSGANNTGTGAGLPALGVNVALYQIMPNAAARNRDLPSRRSDASLIQRPRAAVDLHYLISVYGDDSRQEPHRVMGSVVRTLHTYPYLSPEFIGDAIQGAKNLNGSDLASSPDPVRFVPLALTLDELSRVWSVYFQTSYALSICYQASVVYLEDTSSPSAPLPVRTPNIVTTPIATPSIDALSPQPATAGALLTITGPNVGVAGPQVVIGDAAPIAATVVSATAITVTLPATTPAGVTPISVVQLVNYGTTASPVWRPGVASAPAVLALAPTIQTIAPASVARGGTVTVTFDAPVASTQNVALVVGAIAVSPPQPFPSDPTTTLSFTVPGDFTTGAGVVRLRVDGVDSPLTYDPNVKQFTLPTVTIT